MHSIKDFLFSLPIVQKGTRSRLYRVPDLKWYGLAALSVGVALCLALVFEYFHFRGAAVPVLALACAVNSWYGGRGAAVLAVVLSSLGFNYFFLAPPHSFYVTSSDLPYFIIFTSFAWLLSWFGTIRRRAEAALKEKAELLNLTHDMIFVADMEGTVQYWNRAAEERYGWTEQEAAGRVAHELLKTVLPAPLDAVKAELINIGRWEGELVHTRKNGTQTVVASRWSLQRDKRAAPLAILETDNDITERKRAEEALRDSESTFRTFVDHATDAFFLHDHDDQWRILDVNRRACESLGYTREELIGMTPSDFDPNVDDALLRWIDERLEAGVVAFERHHRRKDGVTFPVEIRIRRFSRGGRLLAVALVQDITERKRAEEALHRSEAYLAEAQRLSHTGSWVFDLASYKYIHASEECLRIFGIDAQQGLPTREEVSRRIHPEDWDRVNRSFEKSLYEKVDTSTEFRVTLPSATTKQVQVIRHPVLNDAGDVVKLMGTVIDITERKRAEEALRRTAAYLAETQRLTQAGTFVADRTTKPLYWSEELFQIFGYDPQQGLPTADEPPQRVHPEDLDKFWQAWQRAIQEKVDADVEYRIVLPDGTIKHVYAVGHPVLNANGELVEIVGSTVDITERKRAEEERERLHRLEADLRHLNRVSMMGELAASVAHEVNQPISGVVSNASACLRWLARDVPDLEEAREAARRIVRDGKRAGEIIARIRALATKSAATNIEEMDLNATIQEVLALVGDEAKKTGVIIRTEFAADVSHVAGDRVQLQQVALNLVMNAIEAMSSVGDRARELVVTTRNIDADQVVVTVEDSGVGVEPQKVDKVFDSFYTTKPGGMGMGLSISRSILQAHGGRLWAAAKDGPGAVFHFTLPKYHGEDSNASVAGV